LGTDIYSYEQAAAASGIDPGKFKPLFESLKQKGFIGIKYTQTDEERYSLHPIIVGWFEAQVSYLIGKPDEKEFARRWMEFIKSGRKYNFFPLRNIMNVTIRKAPVTNQSVGLVHETKDAKGKSIININHTINVPDSKIYPTNSVNDLILEYGTKSVIGQLTCMCRRVTLNLDDPCRLKIPDDGGCLGFGNGIKPAIKYGYARQISKEEAFDVLQKVRDKGAIHTVFHEKDDAGLPQVGICNCCWDCCGILRSYNMGSLPLRYSSFYMAKIADSTKCTGCKKCEKYCPTAAISIVDKKAFIDEKKCIGCGQCVHQCAFSAVELIEDKRTAFLPMLKKSEARITT
jgi:ferredoxin